MIDQQQKCAQFAHLHASDGAFLIPNPWDLGSASILQALGFPALATTSAGAAYALGCNDGEITLDQKLAHCSELAARTSVPINADFENGFAEDPRTVAENTIRMAETGVAGCSIEDFSREHQTLYDFEQSVERLQAAAEAIDSLSIGFQLTARAENLLRGNDDLDDTIKRLQAYSKAGAHVLYAPGITRLEQLKTIHGEVDKPLNVLAPFFRDVSVDQFAQAGARRLSVGSALTWLTVKPLLDASKEMLEQGTFSWTQQMASAGEIQSLLGRRTD